jgi:hypothetical protein
LRAKAGLPHRRPCLSATVAAVLSRGWKPLARNCFSLEARPEVARLPGIEGKRRFQQTPLPTGKARSNGMKLRERR